MWSFAITTHEKPQTQGFWDRFPGLHSEYGKRDKAGKSPGTCSTNRSLALAQGRGKSVETCSDQRCSPSGRGHRGGSVRCNGAGLEAGRGQP